MENWKDVADRKRSATLEKIPNEWRLPEDLKKKCTEHSGLNILSIPSTCGILNEKEIELTEKYDASSLLKALATGHVKAYEVALAFCKRAAIAHQLVNCLTEIFFDQALARAQELDRYYDEHQKPMGPLHGLPISLKDSFNIKGIQTTIAYVSFASNPPEEHNSNLVDLLLSHGAIFYVKTNIPQGMMTADSDNPLFGRTLNPRNLSLTAGGSTGGEGALIALRGSLMGAGTDIAGSIRIPALCNGIYGFKPTAQRVPFGNKKPPGRLGSPSPLIASIGPEAHSVRDLELFMSTVIGSQPWELDDTCLNVPWRTISLKGPFRIGLILEDKSSRPLHPNMLRTMALAQQQLKAKGHQIIDITNEIPSLWSIGVQCWKFFLLDPQKTPSKHIAASGEPWVPSIASTRLSELQGWEPALDELWDMILARKKIMKQFHELMREKKLDAIMMPLYQSTAVPHDTYGFPMYTVLANFLDWPAGAIPFGKANKVQEKEGGYVRDGLKYEPHYDPDIVEDMPTGIQLLAKSMKDEELLKIMTEVDNCFIQSREVI